MKQQIAILPEQRDWARAKLLTRMARAGFGLLMVMITTGLVIWDFVKRPQADMQGLLLVCGALLACAAVGIICGKVLYDALRDWNTDYLIRVEGKIVQAEGAYYTLDTGDDEESYWRHFTPLFWNRNFVGQVMDAASDLYMLDVDNGRGSQVRLSVLPHTRLIVATEKI